MKEKNFKTMDEALKHIGDMFGNLIISETEYKEIDALHCNIKILEGKIKRCLHQLENQSKEIKEVQYNSIIESLHSFMKSVMYLRKKYGYSY